MNHYLGDYVETKSFGYRGRVHDVHFYCPESDSWLAGQTGLGDNPMQYKRGRWVSILTHPSGSVVVPDLPEFIKSVQRFDFQNPWADEYFRDAA